MRERSAVSQDEGWKAAMRRTKQSETEQNRAERELLEVARARKSLAAEDAQQSRLLERQFTALLCGARQEGESQAAFAQREAAPRLLGHVALTQEAHVHAMNMLHEPDELVLLLPLSLAAAVMASADGEELRVGATYAVYARAALFDTARRPAPPLRPKVFFLLCRRLAALAPTHARARAQAWVFRAPELST